ncbi:FMN-linked oxidoreductase [Auriculariales sp. MPI-PUGE-AT-0066]|nr:FMN-linked oxidoreductase [Auriculariales sp. MPI-PUGE-AT-0066]
MTRTPSLSPPPPAKRMKLDLTTECTSHLNYRNGIFLAPMVRSGPLPTRLTALAHGASLVWAPEIVDRAILNAERDVNDKTGVVSYRIKGKAIFTTHPIEKKYLVYQVGSASPELALKAALTVAQDVSAVDLNCGCPKPFSTHGGMGAALLSTPDLLCEILRTLRQGLPPNIAVTAKIRLLATQEATIDLVKRIIDCGVSAVTVHCRTREMRKHERALPHRLKDIVDAVKALPGGGIPIIANGDCEGFGDAMRLRELTGADSVMVATAAENNPSCFNREPVLDIERNLMPGYIRMARYLDNHFGSTKHCIIQFKSAKGPAHESGILPKAERHPIKQTLAHSKSYTDLKDIITLDGGSWESGGESDYRELEAAILARDAGFATPFGNVNPEGGDVLLAAPGPDLSVHGLKRVGLTPILGPPSPEPLVSISA